MGKKSTPKAPDYAAIAMQQAEASKQNTEAQTAANRPNVITPWGTQTWSQQSSPDVAAYQSALQKWQDNQTLKGGPDGIWQKGPARPTQDDFMTDNWTQQIKLSPDQQKALDSQQRVQMGLSQGAESLIGRANQSFKQTPDWNGLPQRGQMDGDEGEWRQKAQDAVWQLQQPGLDAAREKREAQLANMGITRGGEAWNREQRNLGDNENRARLMGIESGRQEANMLFNQDLQGANFDNQNRQQAIAEMMQRRNQPLNELNALLTGQQVQNPNMPSFAQAQRSETPQLLNAATQGYGAQMDAYNAEQAGNAGLMQGIGTIGSAALMFF